MSTQDEKGLYEHFAFMGFATAGAASEVIGAMHLSHLLYLFAIVFGINWAIKRDRKKPASNNIKQRR